MSAPEPVTFVCDGCRLSGRLYLPADRLAPPPVVVHAVGWMSLQDAAHYQPYYAALTAAGIAVLTFDYRGLGESEGPRDLISPPAQVADVRAAVSYLGTRTDVDAARVGLFGTGGTGGGVALVATALDPRVRCVVAMSAIADGRDWLATMRGTAGWADLEAALEANRRAVAVGQPERLVDPLRDIVLPPAERRASGFKQDIADRLPARVRLSTADAIATFVPEAFVERIGPRPLLLIAPEADSAVPQTHTERLYRRARAPKRLVWLLGTSSYRAHQTHTREIAEHVVAWFAAHLASPATVRVQDGLGALDNSREEHLT